MGNHRDEDSDWVLDLAWRFACCAFFIGITVALGGVSFAVATDLSGALRVKSGAGVSGSFQVQGECLPRLALCSWYGTFKPSAGGIKRSDVLLTAPEAAAVRGVVPAADIGDDDRVFASTSGGLLYQSVLIAVPLIALWAIWTLVLVRWSRRRIKVALHRRS